VKDKKKYCENNYQSLTRDWKVDGGMDIISSVNQLIIQKMD
jgi:hypothetical protein